VVLRISLTKWSSYPDMQLSSQLLGLNENFFFPVFFFFFILFAISLEAFSNFLHFFISFSNWFLCSSQAFDCNTLRISNSSSCYSLTPCFTQRLVILYEEKSILNRLMKLLLQGLMKLYVGFDPYFGVTIRILAFFSLCILISLNTTRS